MRVLSREDLHTFLASTDKACQGEGTGAQSNILYFSYFRRPANVMERSSTRCVCNPRTTQYSQTSRMKRTIQYAQHLDISAWVFPLLNECQAEWFLRIHHAPPAVSSDHPQPHTCLTVASCPGSPTMSDSDADDQCCHRHIKKKEKTTKPNFLDTLR